MTTQDITIWNEDGDKSVDVVTDIEGNNRIGADMKTTGKVSTDNSSSTPLGIDGVFTGNWEETLEYAHITVQVIADEDSAVNGLSVQWSSDGVNIDDTDNYTIKAASTAKIFTFGPQAKYFRIVYTNGSVAQTEFRLHVTLKVIFQKPSSHKISDTITTEDDATLTKSVLTGENSFSPGVFENVKVDPRGRLETATAGTILFQEVFTSDTYDTTEKWNENNVAGGTLSVTDSVLKMSVATGATDNAELNTQQFFVAQKADAINLFLNAKLGDTGKANNSRMWGFGDGIGHPNGAFFVLSGTTFLARTNFNSSSTDTDITASLPTDGNFHRYSIRLFNGSRAEFYVDDSLVASHTAASQPLYATKNLVVHLHNFNTGVPSGGSDLYIGSVALSDESKSSFQLIGASASVPSLLRPVLVDSTGRLLTNATTGAIPEGGAEVVQTEFSSISGTVDNTYTITSGKTLTIQAFSASSEVDNTGGNVVELYEDPNGDLSVLNAIDVIFCGGNSFQHSLDVQFVGDGTRRIVMRRRRLSGGSKEIFGRWEGFEE